MDSTKINKKGNREAKQTLIIILFFALALSLMVTYNIVTKGIV